MIDALKQLRMFDWMVVAAGLGFVTALQVNGPPVHRLDQPAPVARDMARVVQIGGPHPSSGTKAAEAYSEFKNLDTHIGAFAASESGAYGYSTGYNSREMAEEVALFRCAKLGEVCRVIAVVLPNDPVERGGMILSQSAQQGYAEHLTYPGFHAFASSESGAWGSAWAFSTPFGARARAMANCRVYLQRQIDKGLPTRPCRFID
ncbi:hypothetical protein [Arenibacterium sp. CAU 1754]